MKRYSLAQLEAFDGIRTRGTFAAAAAALNVTQSTVSLRIRELESALGVKLFDRRGRSAVLSDEGVVLAEFVSQGLALLNDMEEQVRSSDPLHGTLRLGTSDMIAITCLPQILGRLERLHPRLKVELRVTNSIDLAALLDAKKLDVALHAQQSVRSHVTALPIALAEIAWVGGADRPIAGRFLRPRDLIGVKVLTAPPPSPLNDVIRDWCAANRAPMPTVNTCNSVAVMARLVTSGTAMSLLPVCVLRAEIDAGRVIRYRQRVELPPLRLCASFLSASRGAAVGSVTRVAREVMAESGLFEMLGSAQR